MKIKAGLSSLLLTSLGFARHRRQKAPCKSVSMNFRIRAIALLVILFGIYPAGVLAQTTNPSYIAEMPSVDQVMKAMQASDPDETAARQMGAFWQLKTMIEEIAGPRYYKPGLTPEEAKLRQAYYTAYSQISNSKPQYKSFIALRG